MGLKGADPRGGYSPSSLGFESDFCDKNNQSLM